MSRRSEKLKAAAANFIEVHHRWVKDDNRPNPDETYWTAIDELRQTFDIGDIPDSCRDLAAAVDSFSDEVVNFDDRDDVDNPYPGDAFWAARDHLEKVARDKSEPAPLPPLETIADLAKLPNMQHIQIAKMYGFFDRQGRPLIHLVQRELDKPGSVLNTPGSVDGRDWKDPRLADIETHEEEDDDTPEMNRKSRRAKDEEKPCPESPQDLWEQRVPVAQAAKMLKQTEKEVALLFAKFDATKKADLQTAAV